MDEGKIKELETKLREMFEFIDQPLSKPGHNRAKPAANVVIRRRKGQKDKRILLGNPSS